MNKKEIKARLEECLGLYKQSEIALNQLEKCFGNNVVDSAVGNAMFQNFDAYTKALSILIGDESEWLMWYIYDNDCGEKELKASVGKKKTWNYRKKVQNLDDLVDLIIEDKNG